MFLCPCVSDSRRSRYQGRSDVDGEDSQQTATLDLGEDNNILSLSKYKSCTAHFRVRVGVKVKLEIFRITMSSKREEV